MEISGNLNIFEELEPVFLIYVADDDSKIRELLEEVLSEKYQITAFNNGRKLLDNVENSHTKPDLYILDIEMPVLNGIDTAKRIRKKNVTTPIIAISGNLNNEYYKELFKCGFNEAIPKPFSIDVLLTKIQNSINNSLIPSYNKLIDIFTLSMARMGEARDQITENHNRRIGDISYVIAQEIGYSSRMCEDLRLASRLHDVGKISIDDEILQKPGKLSDIEFEYMKSHTKKGASILNELAISSRFNYLKLSANIAMFHHEKLNGSGYPNKISGVEIPGYVRIVTVADIYDAITMKRPYHEAASHEYGVDYLLRERDLGNLDKDVIEAFQKREKEILDIKHTFKDIISTITQRNQLWIPDIDVHPLP